MLAAKNFRHVYPLAQRLDHLHLSPVGDPDHPPTCPEPECSEAAKGSNVCNRRIGIDLGCLRTSGHS
jgi:hypothetical protein